MLPETETPKPPEDLLDLYFSQWQEMTLSDSLFICAAAYRKKMLDDWEPYDLSRAEVMQLIDRSLNIYVLDDQVYQDHVKVKYRQKSWKAAE